MDQNEDDGSLRPEWIARLRSQLEDVSNGERGADLDEVIRRIGLDD